MYDLAALEADLAGTLFAGKLHFVRVTGSTNSDALAAARLGAPPGAVFLAEEQLAGRGRGHHGWISSVGEGLYASVLLRPQFPAARLPLLPLAAGLAAAAAIRAVSGLISRPALAQRSPPRPAQSGRHPCRIANCVRAAQNRARRLRCLRCCRHRHQRASARFPPRPGHARHVSRSGIGPAHLAPGAPRGPATISGA